MTAVMHGAMVGKKTIAKIAVMTGVRLTAPQIAVTIAVTIAVRMDVRPTHPEIATAGLHFGLRSERATEILLAPGSAALSARISAPPCVLLNWGLGLPPERCSHRFRLKHSVFWICCPKP